MRVSFVYFTHGGNLSVDHERNEDFERNETGLSFVGVAREVVELRSIGQPGAAVLHKYRCELKPDADAAIRIANRGTNPPCASGPLQN
jgi:hypothetical protein